MLFNLKLEPKSEQEIAKDEQEEALDKLKSFIKSNEVAISLVGSAGTGKTHCTGRFINWLDDQGIEYTVAAPTHKAKLVIQSISKHSAVTLHQLLALSPNIEILELDYRDLMFEVNKNNKKLGIPYKGVVIVDEASMINNAMFDLLLDKVKENNSHVIFVGDDRQLKPVADENISKVFTLSNKITLTKIWRQKENSPLMDYLNTLREKPLFKFETIKGEEDSVLVYNNTKQFLDSIQPKLLETINSSDILNFKILAYTNARVNGFNDVARKLIFKDNCLNEFNKGEIITGYDNFEYNGSEFWNSMDYIILNQPKLTEELIPYCPLPFNGYYLSLYDSVYNSDLRVFLLSKNNSRSNLVLLSNIIESTRLEAINAYGKRRSELWRKYFRMVNSFACPFDLYYGNRVIKKKTFSYGYAQSVHKSQGSSYNTVAVDVSNIMKVRTEMELRQLEYVALSRTRGDAYLLV